MDDNAIDPVALLRPRRKIRGISAVLLPFTETGEVDWPGFTGHLKRTIAAGLAPAVNMDTGFAHLIDDATRLRVLQITQTETDDFVAGAFVKDESGDSFNDKEYLKQAETVQRHGGIPVIFQSFGLTGGGDEAIVANYTKLAESLDSFIGFELSEVFAPFGNIYSLEVYRGLLSIDRLIGAKHSSLNRELEWRRLMLRDELRPDFRVFTGNDLAIDMVMYGSDYLLGLSTMAPDIFAQRDAAWTAGDPAFYELNDWLQYLGFLTFRPPVPAYKHSAAMFLKLRGWLDCDDTHPDSPTRPESDREILRHIAEHLPHA